MKRRLTSEVDFRDIATVGANVTTYSDSQVVADTTYVYRAIRNAGGGAASNDATVTTPAAVAALVLTQVRPNEPGGIAGYRPARRTRRTLRQARGVLGLAFAGIDLKVTPDNQVSASVKIREDPWLFLAEPTRGQHRIADCAGLGPIRVAGLAAAIGEPLLSHRFPQIKHGFETVRIRENP